MADINLSPYTAESEAIARRIKMAEVLQQQAMQPLETPGMAGGYQLAVSPYAGLAKVLQGYTAMQAGRGAEAERKALGEKYQSDLVSTLTRANELSFGKPAIPEQAPVTPYDDEGNVMPVVAGSSAVAPNPEAAAREYFKHPATQALGMSAMQKELENRRVSSVLADMGVGAAQTTPGQALNAESMAGGSPGPTNAAASRVGARDGGFAIDPLALRLLMASQGNSTLEALAKAQLSATESKAVPEGGALVGGRGNLLYSRPKVGEGFRPTGYGDGGSLTGVDLLPGYADSQRIISEAKSASDIVTKNIGGREVTGTNEQFRILLTGIADTDDQARAVSRWAMNNGLPVRIEAKNPVVGGMSESTSTPGAFNSTNSFINPTAAQSTYSAKRSENFAALADRLANSWEIASKMNGMLDQLDVLYQDPNVASGALAENFSSLKGLAASLNIDIAGRGSEEAIQSITNKFALELRNPSGGAGMPGGMSNEDRTFLASIPPGLSKTTAGRALIAQGMRAVNDRDKQIANMAQQYEERVGRLDNGFIKEMRAWSNANPLLSPEVKQAMQVLMRRAK